MNGLNIRWSNYKSSLSVFTYFVTEFIESWKLNNSNRENAEKQLRLSLTEKGLPEEKIDALCKEYFRCKDRLLGGTIFKGIYGEIECRPLSHFDVIYMMLPFSNLLRRDKEKLRDDWFYLVCFELSRLVIFSVILSRLLAGDIYDVFGSGGAYLAYSVFFGVLPNMFTLYFTGSFKSVFFKSLLDVTNDPLVVSSSGLALSIHSVFGASNMPLYHLIPNSDLVAHFISGFGVGSILLRFFRAFWSNISYSSVLKQVGNTVLYNEFLRYLSVSEVPLVISSMFLIGFGWELFEEIVEDYTVRINNTFFWNGVMDLVMDLGGALTACAVIQGSRIFKPIKKAPLFDGEKLIEAIDTVNNYIDDTLQSLYSEKTVENIVNKLSHMGEMNRTIHS